MKRFFDEEIKSLSQCEIFVFGSNLHGYHLDGAARRAYEEFGAEWGVGAGPTGKCYAIPTMQASLDDIRPYVDDFTEYARTHPNNRFLVTCGGRDNARFANKEIAPMFKEALKLPNVNFAKRLFLEVTHDEFVDAICFGIVPRKEVIPIPDAITVEDLMDFCEKYKYVIGSGVRVPLPKITIRYIIDTDRFGYAKFGDFFFFGNDLYVWTSADEFKEDHNQDVVENYFGDECKGRGFCHRVLFAGVKTPFCDSNGDAIYTGDVLRVMLGDKSTPADDKYYNIWAFDTLGRNDEGFNARYAFVLDNHCATPDMVAHWQRIGTVYYQLDWNFDVEDMLARCRAFQDIYGKGPSLKNKLVLARYTPNFDQELWKYHACDILGIEFKKY